MKQKVATFFPWSTPIPAQTPAPYAFDKPMAPAVPEQTSFTTPATTTSAK